MAYEIDFIGSPGVKKDNDAIAFRYYSHQESRYIVCVFDGGTTKVGEMLSNHLARYYLSPDTINCWIDYVFCSHADFDHSAGLRTILEKHKVRYLIMNRPWLFLDELYEKVKDNRISKESLEKRLKEQYSFISDLEKIANERNIPILNGFQDTKLEDSLCICSPSKNSYLDRLSESPKTPEMESSTDNFTLNTKGAFEKMQSCWGDDAIREDVQTEPENETSIVLRVTPDGNKPFVLTGDAGCVALKDAMDFADAKNLSLNRCSFVQIPHHGGRHNVSPSILNRLLGPIVPKDTTIGKTAFVSVGDGSDHPRKCVVNAFIHRGCSVYVSRKNTLWHHIGKVPNRNWSSATKEEYAEDVESWEDE